MFFYVTASIHLCVFYSFYIPVCISVMWTSHLRSDNDDDDDDIATISFLLSILVGNDLVVFFPFMSVDHLCIVYVVSSLVVSFLSLYVSSLSIICIVCVCYGPCCLN